MKKVVLFALAVAAVFSPTAVQAQTYMAPIAYHYYHCDYTNPTANEVDGGFSNFRVSGTTYIQGTEVFETTTGIGADNRKVTFAKPANRVLNGEVIWTDWEFTINPYGPQCRARVTEWGNNISFTNCTDGSSRFCVAY